MCAVPAESYPFVVDREQGGHVEFRAIMGDSEFAAKDDLQSVRDVVAEHAQKLDDLSQKIEDLSKKLDDLSQKFDDLNSQGLVKDWSSLQQLLMTNMSAFGDEVMSNSAVQTKFTQIDNDLTVIKGKVGS